ncbi:rRNA maturation RNase YbeY [Vallitalea okinawensis]|uniref:rRNA maturation RNase YbeY n=1 Tax=Vallitalea okinawensis TaxID=2078660 RepID=UPI000CFB81EA|nr:rRNA maturation RNase YbeY [Vallitalea okinawensis]
MTLYIENETDFDMDQIEVQIRKVMDTVLDIENVPRNVEISLTYVSTDDIQVINKEHRQKDTPTDVLSFPMVTFVDGQLDYDGSRNPETDEIILGDIIISLEKAKEQSETYGHSFTREVCFLVAHSMLHLLGYDHLTEDEEQTMITKQKEVMSKVGIER